MCEKKPGAYLPGVVNHKLWCSQLCEPVSHTPVHSERSPRVTVVAQEVDGLAVLPGDGTQTSPAQELVLATFGQHPAKFLGVVLVAWHDGASGQDSQFVLQQVEERDGVVKAVYEQYVVLVCDLRVLHETADNNATSDRPDAYVLLDGKAVLGGNHELIELFEAELLAGAVVATKEREHSV